MNEHQELEVVSGSEITRAQISEMVSTAKTYPRLTMGKLKQRILEDATMDTETAEACFYTLKKGGTLIQGPSIRLAEIAFANWGNVDVGTRILSIGQTHVTVQAVCIDYERNSRWVTEVSRRITTKEGKRYSEDVIQTTVQAAQSIAARNAIIKIVPRVIIDGVYQQCRQKVIGSASKSTEATRKKLVDTFGTIGVTPEQLFDFLSINGRKVSAIEELTPQDIADLRGLWTGLKSGQVSRDDMFGKQTEPKIEESGIAGDDVPPEPPNPPKKKAAAKAKPPAPKDPEPKPEPPPADETPAEPEVQESVPEATEPEEQEAFTLED